MSSSYTGQQWSQYPPPRLQLEHEYDFSALAQPQQGFSDSYQFSGDAFQSRQFTSSPPSQSVPLQNSTTSRSSSYTRTGHSPSASIDGSHNIYNSSPPAQNFASFGQNSAFLTTDQREYHNNAATYNFQAATTPTPLTATGLSAITTGTIAAARPPQQPSSSYYLPRSTSQPGPQGKAKRQRVPEPPSEPKDDDMEGDMEEEGGARAKPYVTHHSHTLCADILTLGQTRSLCAVQEPQGEMRVQDRDRSMQAVLQRRARLCHPRPQEAQNTPVRFLVAFVACN